MYTPLLSYLIAHTAHTASRTDESRAAYRAAEVALSRVWENAPAIRRAAAKFGVEVIGEDRLGDTPRFLFTVGITCGVARSHKLDAILCMGRAIECDQLAETATAKRRESSVAYWRESAQNWRDNANEWCALHV